jgi:hypothetical protein
MRFLLIAFALAACSEPPGADLYIDVRGPGRVISADERLACVARVGSTSCGFRFAEIERGGKARVRLVAEPIAPNGWFERWRVQDLSAHFWDESCFDSECEFIVDKPRVIGAVFAQRTDPMTIVRTMPAAGPPGTTVVISGSGFDASLPVRFGGISATQVTFMSSSMVAAIVPPNAKSGPVTIGAASSPTEFVTR